MIEQDLLRTWHEVIALLDAYESLLSASQQEALTMYYRYNLSLSEIAEEKEQSRSAAFDALKKGIAKLRRYEEKLGVVKKNKAMRDCLIALRRAETLEEAKEAGKLLEEEYEDGI